MIDFLKTLDENFSKAVRLVCIVLMAFIFVMFILNVFVRFVPVYNFTQTDDWIQFCLIWMIFLGSLDLVRTKNHFVVDFLADRLSNRKIKIALKILVTIIELLTYFVIFLLWRNLGYKVEFIYAVDTLDAGSLDVCRDSL